MNMDKMSSEERMKNLYNGKRIDRVPFMSSATMYAGKMMVSKWDRCKIWKVQM